MLVIRTNHDIITAYIYSWTEDLIKESQKKGFKILKLEGNDINLKNFMGKSANSEFIFFNGHGSSDEWFDNEKKPFFDKKSAFALKDKVTFARACNSLAGLGPEAVKEGCNAFIGYKKEFWLARKHKHECQPLKDDIAKPILECSNVIVKELIKGKTVKEAVDKSHKISADNILSLIFSKEPLAAASLRAVINNDRLLDFSGDSSAKIC